MPANQTIDILLTEDEITSRVSELGKEITVGYGDSDQLVLIAVLKGSLVFLADLARQIDLSLEIETIATRSYGNQTRSSGQVQLLMDLQSDITDKDVILVEDIVDTGQTLQYLLNLLSQRSPRSLRVCSLLDKPSRRVVEVDVDYVGFTIPDRFVVGYGLDYAQRYRNLPYIGTLD